MIKTITKIKKNIGDFKIHFIFFLFFVFLIPFKKRIEFLNDYSFFEGRFIDYLTFSFYVFEFFLLVCLIFWIISIYRSRKKIEIGNKNILFPLFSLLFFSLISFLFSTSVFISFYYFLILINLILVYLFVLNNLNSKQNIFIFYIFFVFTMFLQSVIVVFQFFQNESLGLHLLGESQLSSSIAGVAKLVIDGEKHIRPYGTFSHPNILAIFLCFAGVINIYLYSIIKEKFLKLFLIISFLSISFSLFLSFSRIAWFVALPSWSFYLFNKIKTKKINLNFSKKTKNIFLLLIPLLFVLLIYFLPAIWWRLNPSLETTWESLGDRLIVFSKSWEMFCQNPWGIGFGNFIIGISEYLIGYPYWVLEPVHNTFFIVLAEIGILGFLSFSYLFFYLFKKFKKLKTETKVFLLMFFVFMFFDHGFWDIRQAQYLFFIFLGILSLDTK